MSAYDFDLIVIGAGSGGVRAARTAAGLGKKVAICEQRFYGGTCVNIGCVPKKLFVYAADFAAQFKASAGFGWQGLNPQFNWQTLVENKNKEIARLQSIYEKMLRESGATLIEGHAEITGPRQVSVEGKHYSAERILIATGASPNIPDIPGKQFGMVSDDIFYLDQLPPSMTIVGAGYIGVEFAGILHRLGVKITLIDKYPLILNGFDQEARAFISQQMSHQGINILSERRLVSIKQSHQQLELMLDDGQILATHAVLFATGRRANTHQLGLSALGLACEQDGRIRVNEHYQSNIASIYALGDVANSIQLTPLALADASRWVNLIYSDSAKPAPANIPTAIFSHPEYACVGLTEEQAIQKYGQDLKIFTTQFRPMKHTLSGLSDRVWMKLIVQTSNDLVVGAHMVGDAAAEIIQGLAIAMTAGATKAHFDATLGIHPSTAEEFVTMRQVSR